MEFTIEKVEKAIDIPVGDWSGNCYAIASMAIKAGVFDDMPGKPEVKLRYGHWLGPVAPGTLFDRGTPVSPHGWVEIPSQSLPGGLIVDFTRWVFEDREPYVYVGASDHYDVAGRMWREAMFEDAPNPCYENGHIEKHGIALPGDVEIAAFIKAYVGCPHRRNEISFDQLFWFANQHPSLFVPWVAEIYQWLDASDNMALIPLDYVDVAKDLS